MILYKRHIYVLLIVFVTVLGTVYTLSAAETGKSFIWSFESGGNTIYLVGSVHVLSKESYPLPPQIENIYHCCRRVVFETNLDSMHDRALQSKMLRRGTYPQGQGLKRSISAETYEMLSKKLESSGMSMQQFDQFRPWMAALTIAGTEMTRLGFDSQLGIDRRFFDQSRKDGKEMIYLESNDFQINLFAGLTRKRQEALLKQILIELDIIEEMFSEMVQAWKSGSADMLDSIMSESFKEFPDLQDRIITKRNRRWVVKILNLARQKGDMLVVVGAAHLVGKNSVIDLLQKKGYKVRQR